MAYWIDASTKPNGTRQYTYFMDTDSDVANLPTSASMGVKQGDDDVSCRPCGRGSVALAIASGKTYMLNSNDVWTEIGG